MFIFSTASRVTVGVLVWAQRVTKRVNEQCLCKEVGELERQNACAVIRLSGVLAIIISRMSIIQLSRMFINYHFPKC